MEIVDQSWNYHGNIMEFYFLFSVGTLYIFFRCIQSMQDEVRCIRSQTDWCQLQQQPKRRYIFEQEHKMMSTLSIPLINELLYSILNNDLIWKRTKELHLNISHNNMYVLISKRCISFHLHNTGKPCHLAINLPIYKICPMINFYATPLSCQSQIYVSCLMKHVFLWHGSNESGGFYYLFHFDTGKRRYLPTEWRSDWHMPYCRLGKHQEIPERIQW